MPRTLSMERETEFHELASYIAFFATHVWNVAPNQASHPTTVLKDVVERHGKSKALEGLRQAVNDTIEYGSDKPLSFVQELDKQLRENKLITFSEIRHRYAASFKRIMRRGRIRNDTEYYLIRGIVAECAASLELNEQSRLEELMSAYESTT
ncbi:MAG: hypothetical protein K2Y28_04485 [Burkholderiaceae bacterium]|nr:hypothetical protein [Burkholderiaceae bacterium]